MTTKSKHRKPKEGDVMSIPLGDGTYGFGQVCHTGDYAFFDLRTETVPAIEEIVSHPVAFRVPTVSDASRNGGWAILGNVAPVGSLANPAAYRNQPVGSNQLFLIVGNQRIPATYEEVKDFEAMSWWFDHHVVQRLKDHFAGCENRDAETLRKVKIYDSKTGQEIGTRQ